MPKNILMFFDLLIKHNEINNGIHDDVLDAPLEYIHVATPFWFLLISCPI